MSNLKRFAAPLATLALVALVAGCPGGNNGGNPAATDPKPTKKPTAEPTATTGTNPQPTATTGGGATPTATPTTAGTLPPGPTPTPTTAPTPTPTPTATATTTPVPTATATQAASAYTQVERLARPAINEGLIRDANLLNVWNMVGPDKDLSDDGAPIRADAVGTLTALGNSEAQIGAIVAAFLPDVVRIDTTLTSGYVTPVGGAANAFTNRSSTNKIPIGGRMIKDDVIDATLALLVPGGLPDGAKIEGLESDNVAYEDHHDPLRTDFPYLADPN